VPERTRQFFEAGAKPGAGDVELASRYLTGELLALFEAQHPRDVVHAAATARWLLARGHDDQELICAALLHDVGKGEQRRGDRVAHVLVSALRLGRAAADPGSRLAVRRALARSRAHAEAGAALLAEAGAAGRTVELMRLHHAPPGADPVLALLQEADGAS
jgi:hypothetical protein